MNKLDIKKQTQIVSALVEGNSIRATCRMTGAAKKTVMKLLVDIGKACSEYQDKAFKNLSCTNLQVDEIWSFCYAKAKNVPEDKKGQFGYGDVWTFVALDADSKLVPSWYIGNRDYESAVTFMEDLEGRLQNRVQLTSDGHGMYLNAVLVSFGRDNIDYSQLIKHYGAAQESEIRYSPAHCIGVTAKECFGFPNPKNISTSYVERQNLTMRMNLRRFTRLTNAFSKKVENLGHAVALHFMYYNFCRIHQSLRVTPAMRAKVTDHLWGIEDIVRLLDSK